MSDDDNEITISCFTSKFTYRRDGGLLRGEGKVYLGGEQEFAFPLSEISTEPIVQRKRYDMFGTGIKFLVFGALAALIFPKIAIEGAGDAIQGLFVAFALAGLVISLLLLRKVEVMIFTNFAGTPLFSVTRTAKNGAEIDRLLSWIGEASGDQREQGESPEETDEKDGTS